MDPLRSAKKEELKLGNSLGLGPTAFLARSGPLEWLAFIARSLLTS